MNGVTRRAIAWQVALATYMQLISWIPLGRWNYQPCCSAGLEQLRRGTLTAADVAGTLAFLLPCILFVIGARRWWRWMMWLSVAVLGVWLFLQLWTWWPPYLFGASPRWTAVYARAFSQTTPILPRWGNHLPPDAMHFTLQVVLLGAVWTSAQATKSPWRRSL